MISNLSKKPLREHTNNSKPIMSMGVNKVVVSKPVSFQMTKKENSKLVPSQNKVKTMTMSITSTNLNSKSKVKETTSKSIIPQKIQPSLKTIQQPVIKEVKPKPKNALKSTMMSRFQQTKQLDLMPCNSCGRTFVPESLKRHEKICKKIFINKRKEFNSAKQRIISKDQVKLMKMTKINDQKEKEKEKPQNNKITAMPLWKQQSLAFRLAMKCVRGGQKSEEEMAYLQKEKKLIKQNMFKCKGCSRFFNQEAGKRHETFCLQKLKNSQIKPKKR